MLRDQLSRSASHFGRRVARHRLDLRAHVHGAAERIRPRDVRQRGDLLDERAVALLRLAPRALHVLQALAALRRAQLARHGRLQAAEAVPREVVAGARVQRRHHQRLVRLGADHDHGPVPRQFLEQRDRTQRRQRLAGGVGEDHVWRAALEPVTDIVFVGYAPRVGHVPGGAQLVLHALRLGIRISDDQQAKRCVHAAQLRGRRKREGGAPACLRTSRLREYTRPL
jgi:hypothetical protein